MKGSAGLFDKRLASLAVIAIIVLATLVLVFDTVSYWRRENGDLAELERRARVLEGRAAALIGGQGEESSGMVSDGRVLIVGDTPGLAVAEFQRKLTFLAERSGAIVRTIDTQESQLVAGIVDPDGNALQRVSLSVDVEVMEQALPDFLYSIETDFPLMVVDGLSLRTNRSIDGAGSWAPSADRPLALRLAVSGFRTERAD